MKFHLLSNSRSNVHEKTSHSCYFGERAKDEFYLTYKFIHETLKAKIMVWGQEEESIVRI